jgi:four helix bundle protein
MSEVFGFEKLEVWQKAIALADRVYKATAAFPNEERFGLVSQMRRAAVSVSAKVAEGSSRWSRVEQARFMEMAYGSLMELVSEAEVARQQGFLAGADYTRLRTDVAEIARMISGLRRNLREETRP